MDYDWQKAGYELGWDYGAYGMLPPESLREHAFVMGGFREAKARKLGHPHDRFVRKWLHLRTNALLRNRIYDAGVTPEWLKHIDSPTCPITDIALTHGTMSDTDWSVDRINNDCAYAIGNLVVVSTAANVAKSSFDIRNVSDMIGENRTINGLSPYQWMRWKLVMSCVDAQRQDGEAVMGYAVVPCIMVPPKGIPSNPSVLLQLEVARAAMKQRSLVLDSLTAIVGKEQRRQINTLVRDVGKKIESLHNVLDVWLNARLFNQFVDLHEGLGDQKLGQVLLSSCGKKGAPLKVMANFDTDALSLESRGYRLTPGMAP